MKKAMMGATWSESEESSEEEKEKEVANMCFMTIDDLDEGSKKDKWLLDIGCSRHMTGDESKFAFLTKRKRGYITFGDNVKGRIIGQGNIVVLRANEKVTRGVGESAKAADRFASCREERMREGGADESGGGFSMRGKSGQGESFCLFSSERKDSGEGGGFFRGSSLEFYTGIYGLEKLRIKEIFNQVKERQIDHGRIGKRFYAMTLNVTEPDIHDFGKLSQKQETLQLSVLVMRALGDCLGWRVHAYAVGTSAREDQCILPSSVHVIDGAPEFPDVIHGRPFIYSMEYWIPLWGNMSTREFLQESTGHTPSMNTGLRIYLHGLHVSEAIHVLKHELNLLRSTTRSTDQA
ncbi:hypothetical protein CK203_080914 [Vitis vinifera]|uniref:Smr domain-containing protein n=1 Tax=Vitis vinifera TaxID=29760 RepID=A0A438C085_VITVI|nr:hypothetical protein CK203_080914 [Vitis vinifera]